MRTDLPMSAHLILLGVRLLLDLEHDFVLSFAL